MIRIKLKKNYLSEVTTKEISPLMDLLNKINANPTQFDNLFGSDLRLVIDNGKLQTAEQVAHVHENPYEQIYIEFMLPVLKNIIKKFSTIKDGKEYLYDFELEKAAILKMYDYEIPQGPRKGEIIKRKEYIKISVLKDIFEKAYQNVYGPERGGIPEYEARMAKIFPVVSMGMENYLQDPSLFFEKLRNMAGSKIRKKIEDKNLTNFHNEETRLGNQYKQADNPVKALISSFKTISDLTGDYSIIISRARIDLVRMSDFQGIQSCHSPRRPRRDEKGNVIIRTVDYPDGPRDEKQYEGKMFDCALHEAKDNGAVAYLLPSKYIEEFKDQLQSEDFFRDVERSIEGPSPMQRIRLRKYIHAPSFTYLLIPELEIYGPIPSKPFYEKLKSWCLSNQDTEIKKVYSAGKLYIDDFVLVGGHYSDSSTLQLVRAFFNYEKMPFSPEQENLKSSNDDPRVTENLLDKEQFELEFLHLAGILRFEDLRSSRSVTRIEAKTVAEEINYKIEISVRDIKIDDSIVELVRKNKQFASDIAKDALNKLVKDNFDLSKVSYQLRYPITRKNYDGKMIVDFYVEIYCAVPENGYFTDVYNQNILASAKFASLFLPQPKRREKFQAQFTKYLLAEAEKYFSVKEQKARYFNHYLRG